MIPRYTRPELAEIWSDHAHFEAMREVEVAAAEEFEGPTQADLERDPRGHVHGRGDRRARDASPTTTRRRSSTCWPPRPVPPGAGSTTASPPATCSTPGWRCSCAASASSCSRTRGGWCRRSPPRPASTSHTLCVGRTHGIHAEPTTFGIKLAGFAFEADRNAQRLERAFAQATVGALSGAVGTYSATSPQFEERVLSRLGLEREPVSTQVVARDRHAELLQAIALAGAGMERFATEIRHLARTEVGEVQEPFGAGQKGSSAMPHKRNPIKSEQVTGLARLLRGNAQAGLEDVALWHERDISHSSVERVILPDSTILLDHMQRRVLGLVDGMVVDAERMRSNLDLTYGALFSQRVLLALVQTGLRRDDAYRIVQRPGPAGDRRAHAAARAARRRAGGGRARPRRDLRLRAVRPLRRRDRRAARRDRPGSASLPMRPRARGPGELKLECGSASATRQIRLGEAASLTRCAAAPASSAQASMCPHRPSTRRGVPLAAPGTPRCH